VQQLRDKLAELKVERNKLGDDLHNAITKAKANVVVYPFRMINWNNIVKLSRVANKTTRTDWENWNISKWQRNSTKIKRNKLLLKSTSSRERSRMLKVQVTLRWNWNKLKIWKNNLMTKSLKSRKKMILLIKNTITLRLNSIRKTSKSLDLRLSWLQRKTKKPKKKKGTTKSTKIGRKEKSNVLTRRKPKSRK